jgi:hypothetical protein
MHHHHEHAVWLISTPLGDALRMNEDEPSLEDCMAFDDGKEMAKCC